MPLRTYTVDEYDFLLKQGSPPKEREFAVVNKKAGKTEWKKRVAEETPLPRITHLHYVTHRVGGPAIEYADGYEEWRVDGQLHREDGPAVVDHHEIGHEWRFKGHQVESYEGFQILTRCSDEDILLLKLKWGKMGR
jgi:hypothetical protein